VFGVLACEEMVAVMEPQEIDDEEHEQILERSLRWMWRSKQSGPLLICGVSVLASAL
jgi:hypothetical protein